MNSHRDPLSRRSFLGLSAAGTAALLLPWKFDLLAADKITLVKVTGGTPGEALKAALEALGGIGQFNVADKTVVVKPNIGWDRTPEQGADTDPELVAAAVKAFKGQGARVQVFDHTCNSAERCYARSGIEAAAQAAGADVSHVHEKRFDVVQLPDGQKVRAWPVYRDWLRADLRVNLPILKHHSLAGVTAGLKNLMGVMGGSRSTIHTGFHQKLIDVAQPILPEITILDARRVLMKNGPTGGSVDDVRLMNTLIAGYDIVAVDAEGARVFGRDPGEVDYLVEAEKRGIGKIERPAGYKEIVLG
jgi:uncharacterized protein (DUF362 family)